MNDRIPPHNQEAERSVLGSMLRDNRVIDDVSLIVQADDFYADVHQKIFRVVLEQRIAGEPTDLTTLANALQARGYLQDLGGNGYGPLSELWDAAPTSVNAEFYARIVRDKARERNLIYACGEISRDAYDHAGSTEILLGEAERKILAIAEERHGESEPMDMRAVMGETSDFMDRLSTGIIGDGVKTGLIDLDKDLCAMEPETLTILGARPSQGKSTLGLQIAWNLAKEGRPVFFVSLEMARLELGQRLACAHASVDGHKLRKGFCGREEYAKLADSAGTLARLPMFIQDRPAQTMLQIAAQARRLKSRHGLALVCVDYLQLVEAEDRRANRTEQVGAVSRRLKCLAKELRCPVLAMAQLSRAAESDTDRRPRLSDLRESGSIEQDADTVFFLHRTPTPGKVLAIIAKQRQGPLAEVPLTFEARYTRFANYADPPFERN